MVKQNKIYYNIFSNLIFYWSFDDVKSTLTTNYLVVI